MSNSIAVLADATGRRKESSARVRLVAGQGKILVNGQEAAQYINRHDLLLDLRKPLVVTETQGKYDVIAKTSGGGVAGQTSAIRLGIARALVKLDASFKQVLRRSGLLTRDPRKVERKKYGRIKARKRFQYSKR